MGTSLPANFFRRKNAPDFRPGRFHVKLASQSSRPQTRRNRNHFSHGHAPGEKYLSRSGLCERSECGERSASPLDANLFASNIYAICLAALILTPGPMVLAVTQERIYWPLAAAGLALMTAAIRVL